MKWNLYQIIYSPPKQDFKSKPFNFYPLLNLTIVKMNLGFLIFETKNFWKHKWIIQINLKRETKINLRKVHIALTIKSSPNFEGKNRYIYKKCTSHWSMWNIFQHIPLINVEHFSNSKREPMKLRRKHFQLPIIFFQNILSS